MCNTIYEVIYRLVGCFILVQNSNSHWAIGNKIISTVVETGRYYDIEDAI